MNNCPICLDDIIIECKTECNHIFCYDCISNINSCPLCRQYINILFDNMTLEDIYDKLVKILDSKSSCELALSDDLINIVKYILCKKNIIEYLLNHDDQTSFKHVYKICIIENQQVFKNYSNKYEDFALTWIFNLHH